MEEDRSRPTRERRAIYEKLSRRYDYVDRLCLRAKTSRKHERLVRVI